MIAKTATKMEHENAIIINSF